MTQQEKRFIRRSIINDLLHEGITSLYHINTVVRVIELGKYGYSMAVYGRYSREGG